LELDTGDANTRQNFREVERQLKQGEKCSGKLPVADAGKGDPGNP
jgi:hypothetical protein